MGMGKYVLQRLAFTLLVILGVSVAVFLITHVVGDPVSIMLPLQAKEAERIALTKALGLDKPLLEQLWVFLKSAVRLDFGVSWWQNIPAMDVIYEKLPATLLLVGCAIAFAIVVAVPLGVIAAYKPNSALDRAVTTFSLVGISMPPFWIGLMLMLIFAVSLGWLPTSGIGTWKHVVLPAVTMSFRPLGQLFQIVRFEMMQQLGSNYVTTARAKGVKESVILFKHALKNIATSAITMVGSDIGKQMGGLAAAVEAVFGWPGFGHLISDTIKNLDFPLLQAEVFFVAVFICLLNLLIDILYALLDPRIRY